MKLTMKFLIFIILIMILTSIIITIDPQMHKTINIGNTNIAMQNYSSIKNNDLKIENKNSKIDENLIKIDSTKQIKTVNDIAIKDDVIDKKWNQLLEVHEKETKENKFEKQNLKQQDDEYAIKMAKLKALDEAKKQKDKIKKQKYEQNKINSLPYQEEILWNKWRADIANTILILFRNEYSNSNVHATIGTLYEYSFNVDENQQISNISVNLKEGEKNEKNLIYIAKIEKIINSLNNSPILIFPEGTSRTSVNFKTKILIASKKQHKSKFYTPDQFNDIEVINKIKFYK